MELSDIDLILIAIAIAAVICITDMCIVYCYKHEIDQIKERLNELLERR